MPNHVTNKLYLKGSKTQLEYLRQYVKGEKEIFEINRFYPMPDVLRTIASPVRILSNEEYNEWKKKRDFGNMSEWEKTAGEPLTQSASDYLIESFGYNNWYDWAIHNWGTKWGSYDSSFDESEKVFTFLTAWDPPINAIMKLSFMFKNIEFTLKFSDEDFGGYVGEYVFKNGKCKKHYTPERGLDSYMFAMDINGNKEDFISRLSECTGDIFKKSSFYLFCVLLAIKENIILEEFSEPVLEFMLEKYVESESYELASEVKKILDKKRNA